MDSRGRRQALQYVPVLIIALTVGQPSRGAEPSSCIEFLPHPEYPLLARQARISGTVQAKITINDSALVKAQAEGHPMLAHEVESFLARSVLPASCSGQTFEVLFTFAFKDPPQARASTTVTFQPPNQFFVTSPETGIICRYRAQVRSRWSPRAIMARVAHVF
jgi:hypothetical protein